LFFDKAATKFLGRNIKSETIKKLYEK